MRKVIVEAQLIDMENIYVILKKAFGKDMIEKNLSEILNGLNNCNLLY